MRRVGNAAAVVLAFATFTMTHGVAQGAVSLLDTDQWKVGIGGFIETDSITDSTRSFNEVVGNSPVTRPDQANGETGREQFSIRNSRLAFTVQAPDHDGWKTKGYLEFDLLGFNPSPGATNTESSLFNNPTVRLRHGYLQADKDGWQLMAGQYWMLMGWQPYYFVPTIQVNPLPGMLYNRTVQFRGMKTAEIASQTQMQIALGVMRPPQRDAGLPGLEAGLRLAYDGWSAGFVGGSTGAHKTQPLSIGVTGAVREFVTPKDLTTPTGETSHYPGHALAVDALVPVIPSSDGKDVGNTLVLGGEYTTGTGYGDQFTGWTGGLASPLSSAATAPTKNIGLDAGLGGVDASGTFSLVKLQTINGYLQYHLPTDWRSWISGGYTRLTSSNVYTLTGSATAATAIYDKTESYFANYMKVLTDQIRIGFEFAQIRTEYADGTKAHNNRAQLAAYFIF